MSGISSTGGNLAAELTLNKIMNGQLETESGRTVNAASRANAANFTLEAAQLTAINPGIREASTNLTALQSDVTGFKSQLLGAIDDLSSGSIESVQNIALNLETLYNDLVGKDLYAKPATAATAIEVNIGNGQSMTIGDFESTYGGATESGAIKTLGEKLTTLKGTSVANFATNLKGVIDAINGGAIDALTSIEGTIAGQIGILDERAVLIDDLTNTFNSGTANQYVQSASGATSLLNNVIS